MSRYVFSLLEIFKTKDGKKVIKLASTRYVASLLGTTNRPRSFVDAHCFGQAKETPTLSCLTNIVIITLVTDFFHP